jgi:hypothetical protein
MVAVGRPSIEFPSILSRYASK